MLPELEGLLLQQHSTSEVPPPSSGVLTRQRLQRQSSLDLPPLPPTQQRDEGLGLARQLSLSAPAASAAGSQAPANGGARKRAAGGRPKAAKVDLASLPDEERRLEQRKEKNRATAAASRCAGRGWQTEVSLA